MEIPFDLVSLWVLLRYAVFSVRPETSSVAFTALTYPLAQGLAWNLSIYLLAEWMNRCLVGWINGWMKGQWAAVFDQTPEASPPAKGSAWTPNSELSPSCQSDPFGLRSLVALAPVIYEAWKNIRTIDAKQLCNLQTQRSPM